jgi:hypothetical protein
VHFEVPVHRLIGRRLHHPRDSLLLTLLLLDVVFEPVEVVVEGQIWKGLVPAAVPTFATACGSARRCHWG